MKKNLSFIFLFFTLLILLINCKEKNINLGKNISFDQEENISYGAYPEQIMDLYIPHKKSDKQREVFIIIHGGGWRSGNKSNLTFFTLSMMQNFPDHIFVNMNYRLASAMQYGIPNQMDDIKSVIVFLEKKLSYRPQVILLGNSAGGHLSMLYAYQYNAGKNIKAVINIVGPSDLSDKGFKAYEEYSFVEKHLVDPNVLPTGTSAVDFASPVRWVTKTVSPTLSFYGKTDHVIPSAQKKILDSVLNEYNVPNESYEFNGGHLDWDKKPNNIFLIKKIETFLKRIDKNKTL